MVSASMRTSALLVLSCILQVTAEAQSDMGDRVSQSSTTENLSSLTELNTVFRDQNQWIQPVGYHNPSCGVAGESFCDGMTGYEPVFNCNSDLWTREHLTNGFFGAQPALAESGILYDARLTHFYQGVTSGGVQQTFEYGGKLDQFVIFEGEKLGLWKGFEAVMHVETRFGEDVIADAAGLAPSNINMLYPSGDKETAITGVQFMQVLNEDWAITFGKINTLDLFQALYPQTGRGIDGFMNTSIFLPLTIGVTVPLAFNGAGILKMHGKSIQGGVVVLDPQNIPTTSGLDNMFANSATVVGLWRFYTDFGGRPGSSMFVGTWAGSTYTTLDRHKWVIEPGEGIVVGQETGSWSLLYILEQQLWADRCNEKRNVGLLSQWSLADPETNPYAWVCNVSLQANGIIRGREADSFGAGWFYNGISSDFKNLLPPLELGNMTGVELYYNAEIAPWFHLTADIQVLEPASRREESAVLFGLRASMAL